MPRYLTVVYEINDEDSFTPLQTELIESMTSPAGSPYRVTAVSKDHEIQRLELMEQASECGDGLMIIDKIVGTVNVGNKTLEDFTDE